MDVVEVLDHPFLVHWEILVAVVSVEVRCQSSQVPYSHPYHPSLAFRSRLEYLEFDQRFVDPVPRVGRVVPPSAVEVGAETLNVALEGRH